jgi:hypothetical protein
MKSNNDASVRFLKKYLFIKQIHVEWPSIYHPSHRRLQIASGSCKSRDVLAPGLGIGWACDENAEN